MDDDLWDALDAQDHPADAAPDGLLWTPPGDADLDVLSFGMGTQSSAIALMSAAGLLPRLDAVIAADTGGELPETYEYARYVEKVVTDAGIRFLWVRRGDLRSDILSPTPTGPNPTPPLKILRPDGSRARINAYRCSYDYKRVPIARATKQLCGKAGAWKRKTVRQWIGYSVEEVGRIKPDNECRCGHGLVAHEGRRCKRCPCPAHRPWRTNVYPLVSMGWTRERTIRWFAQAGHPVPPRSACYFCPNSSQRRWQWLREQHPELFEDACRMDEHCRQGPAFQRRSNTPIGGQMFFHSSCVPLRDADLRTREQVLQQDLGWVPLFDFDCMGDICGV